MKVLLREKESGELALLECINVSRDDYGRTCVIVNDDAATMLVCSSMDKCEYESVLKQSLHTNTVDFSGYYFAEQNRLDDECDPDNYF